MAGKKNERSNSRHKKVMSSKNLIGPNFDHLFLDDKSQKAKVSSSIETEVAKLPQDDLRSSEVNSIVDLDSLSMSSETR